VVVEGIAGIVVVEELADNFVVDDEVVVVVGVVSHHSFSVPLEVGILHTVVVVEVVGLVAEHVTELVDELVVELEDEHAAEIAERSGFVRPKTEFNFDLICCKVVMNKLIF
jgi:hypothetical protein